MVKRFNQTRANDPVIPDDLATKKYVDAGGGSSPLTTKGDVFGFDSSNARIPIGSNDEILIADSTEALGLKWGANTGGAGESNTSSNSGGGEGLALPKVSVDLPFKSLTVTAPLTISSTATEIDFDMDSSGTGDVVRVTSPTLVTPALGTPVSGLATNITGLPIDGGTTGTLPVNRGGTGVTTSTGTTNTVLSNSPTLVTPVLGTPTSGLLTNCTGLPEAGLLNNAVTLAKMAGGTDGNLITYDTSGDPAFVATGTSGHVLTSNGAGTAPTFQAGGGGGSGNTFARVVKKAIQTIQSSTTLQDDDELLFTPTINKIYSGLFLIRMTSGTVPDFKYAMTVPTGAVGSRGGGTMSSSIDVSGNDVTNSQTVAMASGLRALAIPFELQMSSTAGNLVLQWAQSTSDASDTSVNIGASLLVWEET